MPSPRGGLHGRIEETALLPRAPSSSSPSAAASEGIFGASYVMRGSLSASELAEFGTTLMQSGALVSTNLFGPRNDSVNGRLYQLQHVLLFGRRSRRLDQTCLLLIQTASWRRFRIR